MKKMNMKKRFWNMELQLFAGDDGGAGSDPEDDNDPEDDPDDDDDPEDNPDEKKFTQKDLDDAVKKRLGREKRKWQREQQKKGKGKSTNGEEKAGNDGEEDDSKVKAAEERALKAETRAACFEAGVDKDAIDDVTALAHSYMAADEDLDLEDAIEKVVKKYPHFKKSAGGSDDDDVGTKGKSWGERQRGSGKKLTGVEAAFLKKNPGLKI